LAAQNTTTAQTKPAVTPPPTVAAKNDTKSDKAKDDGTDKGKKVKAKVEPPKPKFPVEIYTLFASITPKSSDPNPCYSSELKFQATNAADVAKALSETGYTLVPLPPDRIAIYYKDRTTPPPNLALVKEDINKLAVSDFRYAEAIRVPRDSATKALKRISLPADGSITGAVVDDHDSCILFVSKAGTPDPVVMASLRSSLPQDYWRTASAQPTQRLFHLDASAVVKKLTGATDSAPDKPTGSDSTDASSKTGKSGDPGAKANPAAASKSPSAPDKAKPKKGGGGGAAGGDPAASPSPDDNPDNADASKGSKDTGSGKDPSDAAKKDAPAAPQPVTMQAVNDTLVYSNEDGSDRGFFERNRLMAVLDLPRPEVLMNIWSLQISTKDPKMASAEAEAASELVSHHNEALENTIEHGWDFLSRKMVLDKNFFEPNFYEYVTKKFAEGKTYIDNADALSPLDGKILDGRKKELASADWDSAVGSEKRERWGWCSPHQYCLGFIHAFEPVRPTLTNILLTIMAAKDSKGTADGVIKAMECVGTYDAATGDCKIEVETPVCPKGEPSGSCIDKTALSRFDKCVTDERRALYTLRRQASVDDCELNDRVDLLNQIVRKEDKPDGGTLRLHCFKEQAEDSFGPSAPGHGVPLYAKDYGDTRVGLLRAAVADFLFNYKWASEYPHDFIPYDLTQSAQELNAEFNPLVLAFNRDVKAFTQNLETELQCRHEANSPSKANATAWFTKGDEAFVNDGMISVRGISGVESIVDTVTQSFFDATRPPSLTDLVKSVSDAEKNTPGVLKANLSADEAAVLLGALNSVQPAESKIGRELKLDITPHTLAGASSAELEVKLTADETGNPTLFKADKETEDTISRVARHDTNTRVRVESLKLFDVSSFSAMLQRPRSKFPILPPFFEIPYFGSFIGWPLAGTRVYHRSTAIVSAIIVPTAADLAFGIEFSTDRVCSDSNNPNRPLDCHYAHSPYDFGSLPLRSFHKAMIQCFASGGKTAYTGLLSAGLPEETDAARTSCADLSLVKSDGTTRHPGKTEKTPPQDVSVPPL